MKRLILSIILICTSTMALAVDDPTVVQNPEASDDTLCINQTTNYCITTNCHTSEDRACTDKCKATAEIKCGAKIIDGE